MAPSQLLSTVAFSWEGQDASEVDITHWLTLVTFLPSLHHSGSDLPSLTSPDLSIFFLIWVFLIKPFSYCSWCSQGKNTEVVCHSLLQWTTFCQTSPLWPIHLGWPHTAWLSFIELDKAVVHVIRLASVLWLWFHSVCPLMPSLSTYCLTWVSLTLDMGYLFMAAPAKCSQRMFKCQMPKNAQTTTQLHSSHTLVKYCSKFSKPDFSNRWTMNFQRFKLVLEKAEEPEIKLPISTGSSKKAREFQKNIYFFFIDYAKAFYSVDHNKLWKILKEMEIPDHLTCLLKNLYTGQEATVRTGHGTIDCFQIGKGVYQGCIL